MSLSRRIIVLLLILIVALYSYRYFFSCSFLNNQNERSIQSLINDLDSFSTCRRSIAAYLLQKVGRDGLKAVPKLLTLLKDPNDSVRWRSAAALGDIGIFTDEVKNALYDSINDRNYIVRVNTIYALGHAEMNFIQDENALPLTEKRDYKESIEGFETFIKALNDQDFNVALKALMYLDINQFLLNGSNYVTPLQEVLVKLSSSENEMISGMALTNLGFLVGVNNAVQLIPSYREKVKGYESSTDGYLQAIAKKISKIFAEGSNSYLNPRQEYELTIARYRCYPSATEGCFKYGSHLLSTDNKTGAIEYFEKGCLNSNGFIKSQNCKALGDLMMETNQTDLAEEYHKKVEKIEPFDTELKNTTALCVEQNIQYNCLKMRELAIKHLSTPKRESLLSTNCLDKNNSFSCISLLIDDTYGLGVEKYPAVLKKAFEISENGCRKDEDLQCKNWAVTSCLAGETTKAKIKLKMLCSKNPVYCSNEEFCSEKITKLSKFYYQPLNLTK